MCSSDLPSHFVAIGTSGAVQPAASFVRYAKACGAGAWLNNVDARAENERHFDHVVGGPATQVVPSLLRRVV